LNGSSLLLSRSFLLKTKLTGLTKLKVQLKEIQANKHH